MPTVRKFRTVQKKMKTNKKEKMNNGPVQITAQQGRWLMKHFKHTTDVECAAKLGISEASLLYIADGLGLKKSTQFLHKCQRETELA